MNETTTVEETTTTETKQPKTKVFTKYDAFIIAILAILQFTIILDFMVLSPLSARLIPEMHLSPSQFTSIVSAYAYSAFASGLLAAGFADKFDRKKLLLFFYTGFIIGTLMCGMAPGYASLLIARIVTGLFGGVIGSISFAIITDTFRMEVRGRVMGFVQMAFSASQILGIPFSLYLADNWGWHFPFFLIVAVSAIVYIGIFIYLKPITAHLKLKSDRNAFQHLLKTVSRKQYLKGFAATVLLATGGFMLMPFGSPFSVYNLGISFPQLRIVYLVTGIFSMITGPFIGKLSDKVGRYKVFTAGSLFGMMLVSYYCALEGVTPLWMVISLNVVLFICVTARMISAQALMTSVPAAEDRGAFMSINSSFQYLAGGIASQIAGMIVVINADNSISHYDIVGYVVGGAMLITIIMMYFIDKYVSAKIKHHEKV